MERCRRSDVRRRVPTAALALPRPRPVRPTPHNYTGTKPASAQAPRALHVAASGHVSQEELMSMYRTRATLGSLVLTICFAAAPLTTSHAQTGGATGTGGT